MPKIVDAAAQRRQIRLDLAGLIVEEQRQGEIDRELEPALAAALTRSLRKLLQK